MLAGEAERIVGISTHLSLGEILAQYPYKIHPVCDLFPIMTGQELENLASSIASDGLLSPIVLHGGQVIDGRNRLIACYFENKEPRFVQWSEIYKGSLSVAQWIWDVNGERRHLTKDQIAAATVAISAWEEQEAARIKQAETRVKADGPGRGNKTVVTERSQPFSGGAAANTEDALAESSPKSPDREPPVRAKLATKSGTSERKIQQALNVKAEDETSGSDLLKKVSQGQMPLKEAAKTAKAAKQARAAAAPTAKPSKSKPKKPSFDLEKHLKRCIAKIEPFIEKCPEAMQEKFIDELVGTVRRMK